MLLMCIDHGAALLACKTVCIAFVLMMKRGELNCPLLTYEHYV